MKPAIFPTATRKRARTSHLSAERIPVPHPSWFGKLDEGTERIAPDQFWKRLGL